MEIHEIVALIDSELTAREIYQVNYKQGWPDSLYYGRCWPWRIQIRLSDHDTMHPKTPVINIFIRDGMTRQEVFDEISSAIQQLDQEEARLRREEYPELRQGVCAASNSFLSG